MASPDIPLLIGPQLVGILFNWLLLGVLTVQAYLYSVSFSSDRLHIKLLVYGLYVIECIQTALTTSDAFTWFVYGWGSLESIEKLNYNWFDVPILSGLISMAVQCFFAWRVWVLSKSILLSGVIVVFSLLQGSAAMAVGIKLKIIGSFAGVHTLYRVALVWLVGSAATDVLIAVSMTVLLLRSGSAVFAETKHMIRRLVHLTVETGSLTASMALVALILFQARQNESLYLTPAMIIAKLYSNTLLAVFNNRAFIRRGGAAISTPTDIPSSTTPRERSGSSRGWTGRSGVAFSPKQTEAEMNSVPMDVYDNDRDGSLDIHDKISPNAMPLRVNVTTSTVVGNDSAV